MNPFSIVLTPLPSLTRNSTRTLGTCFLFFNREQKQTKKILKEKKGSLQITGHRDSNSFWEYQNVIKIQEQGGVFTQHRNKQLQPTITNAK